CCMKYSPVYIALRSALIYLICGGLWIFGSDHLLSAFIASPDLLTRAQTYKGLFFVLISAVLVCLLLLRDLRRQAQIASESLGNLDRFRLLFDSSLDAILLTAPDGSILAANPAACRMFEYSEAEICRLGRTGLVDVTDPRLKEALQQRARTGAFMGKLTFVRSSGRRFDGEVSTALFTDRSGQKRTSMIIRDPEQVNRAALVSSLLVEESPYAIGVHQDGVLVFANVAAARLFGVVSVDELIGRPIGELVHPEERDQSFSRVEQLLAGDTSVYPTEVRYLRMDGSVVDVEVTAAPFRLGDRPAVQVIALDISERKRAQEQLRLVSARLAEAQEIERLALSKELHDQVGQSLTALSLNLHLLRTRAEREPGSVAPDSFVSPLGLVDEITDKVRDVMAELHPPVLQDYGLGAALRWYGGRINRQTGLHVEVQGDLLPPRLPLLLSISLFRIAQEALINTVKHASASQAWITLDGSQAEVCLTIQDDGVGFDPQEPGGEAGGYAHWGLSTMRERAGLIDANLDIHSRAGGGTTITVKAPR
ncbi:MAG: PAS domain S-box protein, partial [Chloroflexota bacterium]